MKFERCRVKNYLQTKLMVTVDCQEIKVKVFVKLYFVVEKKKDTFELGGCQNQAQ